MVELKDYQGQETAWCPGCGNFMILRAVQEALVGLDMEPHEVLLVSGIGQSGKLPHYMKCNTFNSLHGRTLPPATGAKLANHELTVIAIAGDGDCYGEGGNHFMHAIRRNINITLVVHNNQVYGLTKGQASPTSEIGFVTKVQPEGVFESAFNPISVAVALNASFVARGFTGEKNHLVGLLQKAIQHDGFALVDILQPCPSFNKLNTFKWYKDRVYKIEGAEPGYDPRDRMVAFQKAQEWGDRIPTGLIYHCERLTMEEQEPVLARGPLVKQPIDRSGFDKLLKEFY
ncbi:MAG: 2-oxoacid:ferredoxin oxidoreductase subunit beta [Candidatus Brocadiales bacterium]|nr:2-oxoacid:ferredoxin oxidoreductase subunit beta [Candidatus Brocadiales bacterium]